LARVRASSEVEQDRASFRFTNQKVASFYLRISRYFSLSEYLQISISSSIITQNCRTYIQNIIEYALKVNYIAKNIKTGVIACKTALCPYLCGKHIGLTIASM